MKEIYSNQYLSISVEKIVGIRKINEENRNLYIFNDWPFPK